MFRYTKETISFFCKIFFVPFSNVDYNSFFYVKIQNCISVVMKVNDYFKFCQIWSQPYGKKVRDWRWILNITDIILVRAQNLNLYISIQDNIQFAEFGVEFVQEHIYRNVSSWIFEGGGFANLSILCFNCQELRFWDLSQNNPWKRLCIICWAQLRDFASEGIDQYLRKQTLPHFSFNIINVIPTIPNYIITIL